MKEHGQEGICIKLCSTESHGRPPLAFGVDLYVQRNDWGSLLTMSVRNICLHTSWEEEKNGVIQTGTLSGLTNWGKLFNLPESLLKK